MCRQDPVVLLNSIGRLGACRRWTSWSCLTLLLGYLEWGQGLVRGVHGGEIQWLLWKRGVQASLSLDEGDAFTSEDENLMARQASFDSWCALHVSIERKCNELHGIMYISYPWRVSHHPLWDRSSSYKYLLTPSKREESPIINTPTVSSTVLYQFCLLNTKSNLVFEVMYVMSDIMTVGCKPLTTCQTLLLSRF